MGGHNVNSLNNDEMLAVKKTSIMVMFLIGIIVIILDYKHVLDVARGVGYAGGSFVLNYARKAYLYDNVENNIFVAMIQYFVIAFGYVNIAILIRDVTKNGLRKTEKKYIFRNCSIALAICAKYRKNRIPSSVHVFYFYVFVMFVSKEWRYKDK